jgi:hypothetical protein
MSSIASTQDGAPALDTSRVLAAGATIVAALAALKLLLHFIFNRGYGYFRDELYFFTCGDRLDWGYADHPPFVALAARVPRELFGDSLSSVRFLPALAGGALVVLTGVMARRLGGGRFAQGLAALSILVAPIYLSVHNFLSMNAFEPLFWMLCAYFVMRMIDGGDRRLWLAVGLVAGVGLLNKHSMAFFGLSLVVGLLLTRERRLLLSPWAWGGGAVAFLVFLPNLVWNVEHNWPIVEILRNAEQGKNYIMSPLEFFSAQVLLAHPFVLPIWVAGLGYLLFARAVRPYRALGLAYVALFVLLVVLKGKAYYLAPAYPMLFAAGAVAAERAFERIGRAWLKPVLAVTLVVGGAVTAPLAIPILPVDTYVRYVDALGVDGVRTENHRMGRLPQFYADMFGWEEIAGAVAQAYNSLPPEDRARCAVFARNYGEAGAVDFFGPKYGLPKAISGHQNYYLWGTRGHTGEVMVTVGFDYEDLAPYFASVEEVARVDCGDCMPYEDDNPVYVCRGPIAPLHALWPKAKLWI